MAAAPGLEADMRHPLVHRAAARILMGDRAGLEDYERSLELRRSPAILGDYAASMGEFEGPNAALPLIEEAMRLALRRGYLWAWDGAACSRVAMLMLSGRWDEAEDAAEVVGTSLRQREGPWAMAQLASYRALLCAWKGEEHFADDEEADSRRPAEVPGQDHTPGWLLKASALAGIVTARLRGDRAALRACLEPWSLWVGLDAEPDGLLRSRVPRHGPEIADSSRFCVMNSIIRCRSSATRAHPLRRCSTNSMAEHKAAAPGFADAAARWRGFGVPYEEAQALLGQGRCLVALGRAPEATAPLAAAHEIFARLGAKPALAETVQLLGSLARDVDQGL